MMDITRHNVGDIVILALKGRLVLEEVEEQLRGTINELLQQGRVNLVLSLEDVSYVDSAGLGFLVSKYVSVHRRGGDIKLVSVTPRVAHVLDITRLSQVFSTYGSEAEAVRAFERHQLTARTR